MREDLLWVKDGTVGLGASHAMIIPASSIPVEDRIIEMCRPELCEGYGKSPNCPPRAMKPDEAREMIKGYQRALLFRIDVESSVLKSRERFREFRKVFEIASMMENVLVESGYTMAKAFGAGSCKPVFCMGVPCNALIEGGMCRYPSLARPSMEAVGMNVFHLVRKVGWNINYIGRNTDTGVVQRGMLVGLVLIH